MNTLRITEIFYSLQGESTFVGLPTVFVRLTGCPLRCQYCDTAYAFKGGRQWSIIDILSEIKQYRTNTVCVTGGEPLAQPACLDLLTTLVDQGYQVTIETSGAMSVADIDPRVIKIMDLKTPDSKESERNMWSNLDYLSAQDQIKFVICSRDDFDWAASIVAKHHLHERHEVLFSPSHEQISPTQLADWILEQQLPIRFQMQLHKVLWNDEPGR